MGKLVIVDGFESRTGFIKLGDLQIRRQRFGRAHTLLAWTAFFHNYNGAWFLPRAIFYRVRLVSVSLSGSNPDPVAKFANHDRTGTGVVSRI
jgi:hypothetical protein